jgi:hypothetical protein
VADSTIWAPVAAALGASLLTGLLLFGVEKWRAHLAENSAQQERGARAYASLLSASAVILISTAGGLRLARKTRTGVAESVAVTTRMRKLMDPLEFSDWIRRDTMPLFEAWAEIWVIGTPEAVDAANEIVNRCASIIGLASEQGSGRVGFARWFLGEEPATDQVERFNAEVKRLGQARRNLGDIARREAGASGAHLVLEEDGASGV